MEEIAWKRDETPYYIFTCKKCEQYMYVKTTQKTKKCLRCGRNHQVEHVRKSSEVVNGISNAVEVVKARQDELAIKKLGGKPELRANGDFKVAGSISKIHESKSEGIDIENEYSCKFKEMLVKISSIYKTFPFYVLEVMNDNYGIPPIELNILTRNCLKEGSLIRLKDGSFKVNLKQEPNDLA